MSTQSTLMLLCTETSMHAGVGQSIAGIDLPIQREVHTQWPCVFGSAVKGALRARAQQLAMPTEELVELFGPDHKAAAMERDASHAGALLIGDARLLLLPVRSLQSCFKWVTCPAILKRFERDAKRLGLTLALPPLAEISAADALGAGGDTLFLEEFRLTMRDDPAIEELANIFAKVCNDAPDRDELKERLVVVSDDIFSFLARNATAVNAHISIDAATKTVTTGALWYEETLPPETVMYVAVTATASRKKGSEQTAENVLARFNSNIAQQAWLQLGGNETTGMGWCRVSLTQGAH